jgi:PBP1b-binding outer membrane lipoprotein LpoB
MRILTLALALLLLGSCSSSPKSEVNLEDALNDALISFTVSSQANRYSDALDLLTYEEQLQIIDGNGNIKPEYKIAMNRVKISALQKIPFTLDSKGCIVGMVPVLDDANRKFNISQHQRSLNLDQVEKARNDRAVKASADSASATTTPAVVAPVTPTTPESALTIDEYLK